MVQLGHGVRLPAIDLPRDSFGAPEATEADGRDDLTALYCGGGAPGEAEHV